MPRKRWIGSRVGWEEEEEDMEPGGGDQEVGIYCSLPIF